MLQFLSASGAGMATAMCVLILFDFRQYKSAQVFFFLLVAAIAHMLMPWIPVEYHEPSYLMQSFAAGLFCVSCFLIFYDGEKLPNWLLVLFFVSVGPPIIYHAFIIDTEHQEFFQLLMKVIPQYSEYALAAIGLRVLFASWGNDMVEARRRLRFGILLSSVALVWALISNNFGVGAPAFRLFVLNIAMIGLFILLFRGNSEIWGRPVLDDGLVVDGAVLEPTPIELNKSVEPVPSELEEKKADKQLQDLNKLIELMATGIYRREDVSLKILAEELKLPEYRVRAVINQNMDYRNFNEFIHDYRIKEAAERIQNEQDTPISNIALDVGYRSLSSFNRAFKKIMETTPTDYREQESG